MTQIPAGWYPDPAPQAPGQPPLQRYWDGQAWTAHVQPVPGAVGYPPVPPAQAGPAPYARPYGEPAGPQQPRQYGGPVAPPARVPGPTTPDGVPLAGWWQRVGAYLIDGLVVGVASSLLTLPLQLSMQDDLTRLMERQAELANGGDPGQFLRDYMSTMAPLLTWSALVGFVLFAVYTGVFLRTKGATPGKMALGLAVRLRDRPGQLPWSAIAARILVQQGVALLAVLPLVYLALSWFPLLDVLWAAWDPKRQALHDKAARTNVVRTR